MKMRLRLSVSPTPVTLNGPAMSMPGIVGARSISGSIAIGCSGESDSANERCTNDDADLVRAGLHLHADVHEARLHFFGGVGLAHVDVFQVLGPPSASR